MTSYSRVIHDVRWVRPGHDSAEPVDLAIEDGRFAAIGPGLAREGVEVIDGKGRLAFPGLVDAHMHVGIYHSLEEDAESESMAAAQGGVTSSLNYMRTGQYYLERGGSHHDFVPEVLARSKGRFHVDYAYHLAPLSGQHVSEMEHVAREFGITSFKIFMFYGAHGLHGRSDAQNQFLMIGEDERYDVAHFERIMRELSALAERAPELAPALSLSLHCEVGEILAAYTKLVQEQGKLKGLRAYSASRPPHSEGLAIFMAAYLANETACPRINLLHLSSRKAIEAAAMMRTVFPHLDVAREVTVGHLLLDVDAPAGALAKVNPPIRPREDVERLWQAVLEGEFDWIVSDHACCSGEKKLKGATTDRHGDIFAAKSGFGGTEYLLSGVFSEGRRRGLSLGRIAELLAKRPAERYGLWNKGEIAVGKDADLVLFDPNETFVVRAADSFSGQGYTPFEGQVLTGKVKSTYLRGELIYDGQRVVGAPSGRFLRRPYGEAPR